MQKVMSYGILRPIMKVLIIEDEQDIRDSLKFSLEAERFSVAVASDGEEGLSLAHGNEFDLVILDQTLPGKTGVEICTELRATDEHLPIIMLSAQTELLAADGMSKLGVNDFVSKPFTFDELLARVKAVLFHSSGSFTGQVGVEDKSSKIMSDRKSRTNSGVYLTTEKIAQLYRLAEFGRLAAGLFHDLINPLTSISLYLEKINSPNSTNPEQAKDYLTKAIESSKRIERLTQAMRRQLQHQRTKEHFSVNEGIRQAIYLIAHKAWLGKVHVSFNDPKEIVAFGDPLKLHQVLVNLLSNAIDSYADIKRAPGRKRKVAILLTQKESEIILTVRDWGCGMGKQVRDNIFQTFYTTKLDGAGLGIGLSTTKDIIEKELNGTIQVKSSPGRGATFRVSFNSGNLN